jgi:class 3 adenylate cyclase
MGDRRPVSAATEPADPTAGSRKAGRFDPTPLWVGLAMAVVGSLSLIFPWAAEIEARATDLLFRHGRADPPRADPRILHVDIDDNAIGSIGRWPWPRSRLADAIDVLSECGAEVIALDLLLTEPELTKEQEEGEAPVDPLVATPEDARLAESFRQSTAKIILPVDLQERGLQLGELWSSLKGRALYHQIVLLFRQNILLTAEDVIRRIRLKGVRARRVRGNVRQFKRVAADAVAERLYRQDALSVDAILEAMVPAERQRGLGDFPERSLLEDAVARRLAVAALARHLPDSRPGLGLAVTEVGEAPILHLARASDGVGFVNYTESQDADGHVRRLALWKEHGDRLTPQLGLAAAAAFLNIPLTALDIQQAGTGVGETWLPARGGRLVVSWPRIEAEYGALGLLRQGPKDSPSAGHISIGRLVSLVRARRKLEVEEEAHRRRTFALARYFSAYSEEDLQAPERMKEFLAEVRDEIKWRQEDMKGVSPDELTQEERDKWKEWLEWDTRDRALPKSHAELDRAAKELRRAIQGKLVFVGWIATGGLSDHIPTAVEPSTPGVVVHAMMANAALTGNVVYTPPRGVAMLIALLLGAAAALGASRMGPMLAAVLAVTYAAVYGAVNAFVFFDRLSILVAMVTPIGTIFLAWAGASVVRLLIELRERARLTRQFGSRIAKPLFDYLLHNPEVLALEGEQREVTSFFSDLAGFTAVSESMDSRSTVRILNRYMAAMNEELTERYAYVNKFLGDGVMAVWGALSTGSPHAERACRAALACRRRLALLNGAWKAEGVPPLSMRIGIASGEAVVGDCGAPPDLRDFTVIGNSVNLAARLESANKQFDTGILINGRAKELLPEDLLTRPMGRITVVGQATPTEIHELMAEAGERNGDLLDRIERTDEAVRLFLDGQLDASAEAWRKLQERHGPSKLSHLYLAEIKRLQTEGTDDFDGVLRLTAK